VKTRQTSPRHTSREPVAEPGFSVWPCSPTLQESEDKKQTAIRPKVRRGKRFDTAWANAAASTRSLRPRSMRSGTSSGVSAWAWPAARRPTPKVPGAVPPRQQPPVVAKLVHAQVILVGRLAICVRQGRLRLGAASTASTKSKPAWCARRTGPRQHENRRGWNRHGPRRPSPCPRRHSSHGQAILDRHQGGPSRGWPASGLARTASRRSRRFADGTGTVGSKMVQSSPACRECVAGWSESP